MRHIETLAGNGFVTPTKGGPRQAVKYRLEAYKSVTASGTLCNPHSTTDGSQVYGGWVQPRCFEGNTDLTLTLEDGRTAQFWFGRGETIHLYSGVPDKVSEPTASK